MSCFDNLFEYKHASIYICLSVGSSVEVADMRIVSVAPTCTAAEKKFVILFYAIRNILLNF